MATPRITSALFLIISITSLQKVSAQATDSLPKTDVPKEAARYVGDKFPFTRLINTEFRYDAPYDYSSKLEGGSQPESRVTQLCQTRVSANINFFKSPKWVVSTGLFYNYVHAETQTNTPAGNSMQTTNDMHYYAGAFSVTRFSKLFGKMAIYSASVTPTGGAEGIERVTGIVSATLVLKANAKTKMTIGLLGLVDPSSLVPAFMTFSYEHKFNNGWIVDVILPKRVFIKKDMFKDGRLSIGTELDGTTLYLNGFNGSNKTYMLNQMELLNGVTYEHCFFKGFIGTVKTGFKYSPASRISKVNEKFDNYIYSATPKPNFYLNFGLSYNP